jgi:membrane protein implicated in regulation of membrane protease activity
MDKNMLSARVLLRYTLFQLPAVCVFILILVFIGHWIAIPAWTVVLLTLLWLAKDAVMYPVVWRAYDDRAGAKGQVFIGESGTVTERLSPSGYIAVKGELWRAEVEQGNSPLDEGTEVKVKGVNGLTLIVEEAAETAGRA